MNKEEIKLFYRYLKATNARGKFLKLVEARGKSIKVKDLRNRCGSAISSIQSYCDFPYLFDDLVPYKNAKIRAGDFIRSYEIYLRMKKISTLLKVVKKAQEISKNNFFYRKKDNRIFKIGNVLEGAYGSGGVSIELRILSKGGVFTSCSYSLYNEEDAKHNFYENRGLYNFFKDLEIIEDGKLKEFIDAVIAEKKKRMVASLNKQLKALDKTKDSIFEKLTTDSEYVNTLNI